MAEQERDAELEAELKKRTEDQFEAILSDSSLDKFSRDEAYQTAAGQAAKDFFKRLDDDDKRWRKGMIVASAGGGDDAGGDAAADDDRKRLTLPIIRAAVDRCYIRQFRERILRTRSRCDGRLLDQLRLVKCETNLHEPLHGSALFQRWGITDIPEIYRVAD